jgi:predicted SnoaL-like aldol condensation-catalyzing enzyme
MIRILIGALLLTTAASAQTQSVKSLNKTNMTNKEKAAAVNQAVEKGDASIISDIVREDYVQHTPPVPDGRKGLIGLITKIANKEMPAPVITNVRVFEDGDFVVLHHDVKWPNRKVMIEVFRFKDGVAAEHWSAVSDHPEKTVSGNSMVDGATAVTDKHLTQKNKELVKAFVETVLIKGQFDKIPDYYRADIIQHNPFIDDTIEGLKKGIGDLQKQGITLQIEKIHYVLGEGNFVLTVSEGKFAGKPTAFYDLFRVENGKVAEHWDVLQEIPEKMAHNNGMF